MSDGGPAFPTPMNLASYSSGMTLRDYFAAKAMQELIRNALALLHISGIDQKDVQVIIDQSASGAYEVADAMLKAREAT